MGIAGLTKLINKLCPDAISSEPDLRNYSGKTIAMDASLSLFQCLWGARGISDHLLCTFHRTMRCLEHGVIPLYVFDGKQPQQKQEKLKIRARKRQRAKELLKEAESRGDLQGIDKYTKHSVQIENHHLQESKYMLKMMGIPFFQAPGEAEAQCAALERERKVYATITEDMDALVYGCSILLRNVSFKTSCSVPIREFRLDKILTGLQLNRNEFIDLSILLGCDYCKTIPNIGPKRAIALIKKHGNIETVLDNFKKKKFYVPENWAYKDAREAYTNPVVSGCDKVKLGWECPDKRGITDFLCGMKQLNEDVVRTSILQLLDLWHNEYSTNTFV